MATRVVMKWAVEYPHSEECDLGYTHHTTAVLVGLNTKAEAIAEAMRLNGRIKKELVTPRITDDEIEGLRNSGIPIIRTPYGIGFEGLGVALSDRPESLESLAMFYKQLVNTMEATL